MRATVFFLCFCVYFTSFSQIDFEKGYIISNDGSKIECYIKNVDKLETPTFFEYKMNPSDTQVSMANIANAKEVAIGDKYHYVKYPVKIDVSRQKTLSANREPELEEKTLFIQRIVDSDNSLYRYTTGNLNYFYYKKADDTTPTLLVFKQYIFEGNRARNNEYYKQQLLTEFVCESIELNTVEKLSYTEQSLQTFFVSFNKCLGAEVNTLDYSSKGFFNLKIAPRVNFNKINVTYYYLPRAGYEADFDNKVSFGAGVELEYVLGFNNNKWSVFIEPNYHSFEGETFYSHRSKLTDKTATIKYSSVEVPIGFRYYMFIDETSKIFVNAGYIMDIQLNIEMDFQGAGGGFVEGSSGPSGLAGVGYNFNNKFDFEFRYNFTRNLSINWEKNITSYDCFSLIARYNFL